MGKKTLNGSIWELQVLFLAFLRVGEALLDPKWRHFTRGLAPRRQSRDRDRPRCFLVTQLTLEVNFEYVSFSDFLFFQLVVREIPVLVPIIVLTKATSTST